MRTGRAGQGMHAGWRWLAVALLAGVLASPATAAEVSYLYLPIDVPDAVFTQAFGINERGDVVGIWRDAANVARGFVLRDGAFETVAVPGAVLTQVRGINARGEIVGVYRLPGESAVAFHGFLRGADGAFAPLDYPDAPHTIPQRILDDGTVVGCFHGADTMGSMYGVLRTRDGDWVEFDQSASMHNGARRNGDQIVGTIYMAGGMSSGYVVEDGLVRSYLVPGGAWTEGWDINQRGQVVGSFGGSTLASMRAYLLHRGTFSTLQVPGAIATFGLGINDWGAVVGRYVDAAGRSHGYLAVPRPESSAVLNRVEE